MARLFHSFLSTISSRRRSSESWTKFRQPGRRAPTKILRLSWKKELVRVKPLVHLKVLKRSSKASALSVMLVATLKGNSSRRQEAMYHLWTGSTWVLVPSLSVTRTLCLQMPIFSMNSSLKSASRGRRRSTVTAAPRSSSPLFR